MVLGFIILSAFRCFALGRKTNPVECDMHDTDMNVHEPLLDTRMVHDHISHASNEPFVVDDPDLFCRSLYQYHYHGFTLRGVILHETIVTLHALFTVFFSIFLVFCINYSHLFACKDEDSCQSLDDYLHWPLSDVESTLEFGLRVVFITALIVWCAQAILGSILSIASALEIHRFVVHVLCVNDGHAEANTDGSVDGTWWTWHEVCNKVAAVHNSGRQRLSGNAVLSSDEITQRVLRKDHYMMGLLQDPRLSERLRELPFFLRFFVGRNTRISVTPTFEWALSVCVLEFCHDHEYRLRRVFRRREDGLRSRLMCAGVILFLLLPFTIVYELTRTFLQHVPSMHFSGSYVGPRQWTTLSLWCFRVFGEMPDAFERRMLRSYGPANAYLTQSKPPEINKLLQLTAFTSGALSGILILFSAVDEAVLLYVHLGGHNLLWWLGIFGGVFAGSRAAIYSSLSCSSSFNASDHGAQPGQPDVGAAHASGFMSDESTPTVLLSAIAYHTGRPPRGWRPGQDVRQERRARTHIRSMLENCDVISTCMLPLVLCWQIAPMSDAIADFVTENTVTRAGIGDVFVGAQRLSIRDGQEKENRCGRESANGAGSDRTGTDPCNEGKPAIGSLLLAALHSEGIDATDEYWSRFGSGSQPDSRPSTT